MLAWSFEDVDFTRINGHFYGFLQKKTEGYGFPYGKKPKDDLPEKNRQVQGSRELGKGPHLHGAQLPRAAAIQRSKGRWDQGTTAESSLGGLKRLKAGDLGQITVKWWSK